MLVALAGDEVKELAGGARPFLTAGVAGEVKRRRVGALGKGGEGRGGEEAGKCGHK